MTRIAGIQPGYLPWLGYFDQMLRVDAFLIADEMPYSSGGWAHRNRVKGPDGAQWLSLPARAAAGQAIHEVALAEKVPWRRKQLTTLRHLYAASDAAADGIDALERELPAAPERLVEATLPTVRFLAEQLAVATPILVSSELSLEARYRARFPDTPGPSHRIVAYLEALGADSLLEGETGASYLDVQLLGSFGMDVEFHAYEHPVYPQLHGPFVSHLSALDLVLCRGREEARRLLRA